MEYEKNGWSYLNDKKRAKSDADTSIPKCEICQHRFKSMKQHLRLWHMTSVKEYEKAYGVKVT